MIYINDLFNENNNYCNNNNNKNLIIKSIVNEQNNLHQQHYCYNQNLYPNMDNNENQGITKRTVIIHKDSRGYGMRISGDNPVFIQHVNEDGAAYKAGVRSGDIIVKVNGTLVTKKGHAEVVRMIQSCGLFVGLTLHTGTTTNTTINNNNNLNINNNNNNNTTLLSQTTSSSLDSSLTATTTTIQRQLSPTNSPTPSSANITINNQSPDINSSSLTTTPFNFNNNNINNNYSQQQIQYPMNMLLLTSNNSIQITGPQPVPESTQQQYHENQIRTIREMINKELRHYDELRLMCAKQSELDSCQKRINEMTSKLEMHQSNIAAHLNNNNNNNSHSRQHSFDNSSTLISSQELFSPFIHHTHHQRTNSSSDQTLTKSSPRIIPMDEDVDNDFDNNNIYPYEYIEDYNNNNNNDNDNDNRQQQQQQFTDLSLSSNTQKSSITKSNPSVLLRSNTTSNNRDNKTKRDSKILPIFELPSSPTGGTGSISISNPKSWYNLHLDSLRMSRYLIQYKMQPPNELLFYVMARNVFPRIITSTTIPVGNKFQVIQRWAYQIIATFVTKESPLFMQEFPPSYLEQFDRNLMALISANPSATDIIASPFDPFLTTIYEKLQKQWEEFMLSSSSLSSSIMNSNPKHDLQAIIEMLLTTHAHIFTTPQQLTPTIFPDSKIDLRNIDTILDSFVLIVKTQQCESTMALISSLLAIGRYIFQMTTSKHCLLLECSGPGSSSSSLSSSLLSSSSFMATTTTTTTTNSAAISSSMLTFQNNNNNDNNQLNPLLKLSSESTRSSKSGHKRNSMLPMGSKSSFTTTSLGNSFDSTILLSLTNGGKSNKSNNNNEQQQQLQSIINNTGSNTFNNNSGFTIEDRSHSFVSIVEMNKLIYCASCMLPMWGDPYTWKCTKCLMYTHEWCRKTAAAANICNNDTHHHLHQHQNSISSQFINNNNNYKNQNNNRRVKSEKKSVFEKFAVGKRRRNHNSDYNIGTSLQRTQSSSSSSSSTSSISSENSSSDLDDLILSGNNNNDDIVGSLSTNRNNIIQEGIIASATETATATTTTTTTTKPNLVSRSGSFVQRKKKKSNTSVGSPRKRSDPALTSRQMISTMANNGIDVDTAVASTSGALPQLTSARSSGALMNSASVGAHDSVQFRSITGQRAKHMTASDSSLMAVHSKSIKSNIPNVSSNATIFTNNDSQKVSSTNLTSTSSPRRTRHRNTNDSAIQMDGSSEDDIDDQQLNENEQSPPTNESGPDNIDQNAAPPPIPPPPPHLSTSSSLIPPPLPPRPDSQTEKRRQIQKEIIQTEEEHFEVLRHIRKVYQKPLKKDKLFSSDHIDIIFGNIKELRTIHKKILSKMNHAYKLSMHHAATNNSTDSYHLEETLRDIFCGELGAQLEQEATKFCVNRKIRNGTELWNQRKKDSRLRQYVDSDARTRSMPDNPLARLGLDDLLSRVFQRPLRYPLLFERLLKSTSKETPGHRYLEQVMISIRQSNERINEQTKKAELRERLSELIRKSDFSSSSYTANLLEQHELLHEGPLVWRITKQKLVDVLLVLTDQIILVLTRESNDRYVLRTHINPTTKHEHRPHVKMDDLLMRDVATDQSAFFLVSKNQDIIYEFAAQSTNERKKWKEIITEAIEKYRTNHSIPPHQTQRSFQSSRSMTMMDFKTTTNDSIVGTNRSSYHHHPHYHHNHHQQQQQQQSQPPPLPPPIQNRPLPKLPVDSQHSSTPPPIPPPSAASFANRPLPQPPNDPTQPPPLPTTPYPTRVDGNIHVVTKNERYPSSIDFIPFSQVKIKSSEQFRSGQTNRNKADDLQEINDNLQNMIQERRRSGIRIYDDLAKEIQEMSMVYDIAKHDDSKEILIRLISDMFRKATEWSYHLVQDNNSAKQELSQRVRNSVESFVKSYIDSNFILALPSDIDANIECTEETFFDAKNVPTQQQSTTVTDDDVVVASTSSAADNIESMITPMMANMHLSASVPNDSKPHNRIRRSLSDNYEKFDKTKTTELATIIHDDRDSNSINGGNESNDNNYDIVSEENFCQTLNDSTNSRHSAPFISPIPLLSSSSSNPFISSSEIIMDPMETSIPMDSSSSTTTVTTTTTATTTPATLTTNLEINSLSFTEEFVVVLGDEHIDQEITINDKNNDYDENEENNDDQNVNDQNDHQNNDEEQTIVKNDDNEIESNDDNKIDDREENSFLSNSDEQQQQQQIDNNAIMIQTTLPSTTSTSSTTTTSQMYLI